ncbi:SbcC/MukB-like Walker B domain-containing protein [Streptomyces sp. NPDC005727]|uniref:SbcC/MukB-like Walker B domain-containing protein n=1 Tax=Streptomyces sp. NPDC005727 TaxID=3157053 RepID=UPI0034093CCD
MSRDQFCQVVLLPQNEFTKFLHADAHGRRELLGKLFRTGRFSYMERWLNDHSRTTEKNRDAARADVLRLVERIHQAAGPDLKTEYAAPTPDDPQTLTHPARAWARDLLQASQSRPRQGPSGGQDSQGEPGQAASPRSRSPRTPPAANHLHHRPTATEPAARTGPAPGHTAPAPRPGPPRPTGGTPAPRAATAADDHTRAQSAERAAREHLLPEHTALDAVQMETAEQSVRAEAAVLDALTPEEDTVRHLTTDLQRIDTERQDFAAQQRTAQQWLEEEPAWRRTLEIRREAARRAEEEGHRHQTALDTLEGRLEAAKRRDAHLAKIAKAEQHLADAQNATGQAGQAYIDIRRRRTEGMAAELAATLTDGTPCPVCGSRTHPAPAAPQEGQPTREDEQAAEAHHEQAKADQDAALAALQKLREQAAAATGEAGDTPLVDLQTQHGVLTALLADALKRAADQGAVQEELLALDSEHTAMTEQHSTATAGLSARNASYDTITERLTELNNKLAEARGSHPTVAARVDELTHTANHLKEAAEASRNFAAAIQVLTDRTTQATHAAKDQGFDALALAQQALLSDEDLRAIEEEITQWREARAAHTAVLEKPELRQAAQQPPVDLDTVTAARAATDDQHADAVTAASAARIRSQDLTALTADLEATIQRLEPLEQAHRTARHLAELVTGNSTSARVRMQLEAYVLAARLEEVVTAANTRLHIMSEGRYTLRHSDHQAARGARSGLGLEITDSWTGRPRKTDTLSGGESFFASLSLALGLADVVTREAGGNPLDTLFIDESFGTLDEDTLHKVLDVLDSLRTHDRTVGVISHIPELRRRITHRLHVRKEPTGSTLAHLAEAAE